MRPDPSEHPGRHDGEAVHDRLIGQPISAASSLAYLGAGWWLWRQRPHSPDPGLLATYSMVVAANGLGGMVFHGPGDPVSRWTHDAAISSTLAVLATAPLRQPAARQPGAALLASALATIAVAWAPRSTNRLTGGLAIVIASGTAHALAQGQRPPKGAMALAGGSLVVGVAANAVARSPSGAPRQGLRATGHAWWHLCTAVSLAAWGSAVIGTGSREFQRPGPNR